MLKVSAKKMADGWPLKLSVGVAVTFISLFSLIGQTDHLPNSAHTHDIRHNNRLKDSIYLRQNQNSRVDQIVATTTAELKQTQNMAAAIIIGAADKIGAIEFHDHSLHKKTYNHRLQTAGEIIEKLKTVYTEDYLNFEHGGNGYFASTPILEAALHSAAHKIDRIYKGSPPHTFEAVTYSNGLVLAYKADILKRPLSNISHSDEKVRQQAYHEFLTSAYQTAFYAYDHLDDEFSDEYLEHCIHDVYCSIVENDHHYPGYQNAMDHLALRYLNEFILMADGMVLSRIEFLATAETLKTVENLLSIARSQTRYIHIIEKIHAVHRQASRYAKRAAGNVNSRRAHLRGQVGIIWTELMLLLGKDPYSQYSHQHVRTLLNSFNVQH